MFFSISYKEKRIAITNQPVSDFYGTIQYYFLFHLQRYDT